MSMGADVGTGLPSRPGDSLIHCSCRHPHHAVADVELLAAAAASSAASLQCRSRAAVRDSLLGASPSPSASSPPATGGCVDAAAVAPSAA